MNTCSVSFWCLHFFFFFCIMSIMCFHSSLAIDWENSRCLCDLWCIVLSGVQTHHSSCLVVGIQHVCLPLTSCLFLLIQMPRQVKALRFNNNVPVFVSMWQVNIVKVYYLGAVPSGICPHPPFFYSVALSDRTHPRATRKGLQCLPQKGKLANSRFHSLCSQHIFFRMHQGGF